MRTESLPRNVYMPTDIELKYTGAQHVGRWKPSMCITCDGKKTFLWYDSNNAIVEWECDCEMQLVLSRWLHVRGFSIEDQRIRRRDMTGVSDSAKNWLAQYAETDDVLCHHIQNGVGAVLRGAHGSGKTSLATLVAKSTVSFGFSPVKTTMPLMVDALQGWGDRQDWYKTLFRHADLLVIDDFGNKSTTTDKLMPTIDRIVTDREVNYRPTIFTTNLTQEKLDDGYGYVIASALKSGHGMLDISISEDWRDRANARKHDEKKEGLSRPVTLGRS